MIRVSCLLYDGFVLLDMAGPLTAFEAAGRCGAAGYAIEILAFEAGLVTSSCGVAIQAQSLDQAAGCDLLIIPGGVGAVEPRRYANLLSFIRQAAARGARVASICSGAFVLAESGLLDGKVAATHWRDAPELARRYPAVTVDAESLYVRQGQVWTSAGVSSGIDLALALIEQDYGAQVARRAARELVVAYHRPGRQSQHSALLDLVGGDNRFNEVLVWARGCLHEPLGVERLADRAALSVRHFTRAFTDAIGMSPARAVEHLRLEAARAAIESSSDSLERIAGRTGFSTSDRMRRAFLRGLGETPQTLRRKAATLPRAADARV